MEISITILVVAIIVGAIAGASRVVEKAQEIFSESGTTNSTVTSVKKLKVWLETTNSDSFDIAEYKAGQEINNWYDKTPSAIKINAVSTTGSSSKKPTLTNNRDQKKILDFQRKGYFLINGDFINGTNYTVFAVAATRGSDNCDMTSSTATTYCLDNFFIGDDDSSTTNNNKKIALGYKYDGSITHSRGGDRRSKSTKKSYYNVGGSVSDYYRNNLSDLKIFTFSHSQYFGNKTYENGILVAKDTIKDHINSIDNIAIGKNFDGRIGEIIIYATTLNDRERYKIEDYLGQKWGIEVKHEECLNGIISNGACVEGCSTGHIAGISEAYVTTGTGVLSCNTTNNFEAGKLSYSCNKDKTLEITSTKTSCDCASGYILSGGTCVVPQCDVATIPGTSVSGTTISDGTDVVCDQTGYDGATIDTCSGGVDITSGTCNCASGYILSGGACVSQCSVATIAGTSASGTTVADGTVVKCDQTGYDQSTIDTCSSGNPISGSCGCASGYNMDGGTCKAQCTISASSINVSSDIDVNSGSTSYDCSNSGKYGTINYSCDNGSLSSVTKTCKDTATFECSGGDITDTTSIPGYNMHIFTTLGDSTLDCSIGGIGGTAEILVVAGGGGGGGVIGGGGGAGGLKYNNSYSLNPTSYTVRVGDGGNGGEGYNDPEQDGKVGNNSIFDVNSVTYTITANGGGGGGHHGGNTTSTNSNGGSGGGGARSVPSPGTGITGQGNNGGNRDSSSNGRNHGGGGGGAGSVGGNATSTSGGAGGAGVNYSSKFSTNYGDSGWFASGGGGGTRKDTGTAGTASAGGGGDGTALTSVAQSGQNNTGGGGGGAGFSRLKQDGDPAFGGKGGSGIVIVKYPSP